MAWYLKRDAWGDDSRNYRSCFLIREKNKIVLYFSLQCGLLFKCNAKRVQGITHKDADGETKYYIKENILDVSQAVPGIELGHFCVNDSYKRRKKEWVITHGVLPYTVGAYIFYKFIAPKVIEISQIVGSQYLYLFCADDGSESLLNYYVNVLNFSIMDQMACVRTEYDRGLTCLTIKIETLKADLALFNDMYKVKTVLDYLHKYGYITNSQAKREHNIEAPPLVFEHLVAQGYASIVTKTEDGRIVKIKRSE